MCSLLGSILHTAVQLEKHPVTPPQPPKLNKENGSVRSEASLPWKELSVENVSGKKRTVSIVPVTFSSWILSGDKKNKIKNWNPSAVLALTSWCSSCKCSMTLTVNEFNEVKSIKAARAGLYQANVCSFSFNCTLEMLQAENRGHKRLWDLSL